MKSVLQNWVMELPLREQGVLLTCIRGCDLTPKLPLESTERKLVGWIRYCVLNPADPREVRIPGAFFNPVEPTNWKPSALGHYPMHWVVHVMHGCQVIGYRHPNWQLSSIGERLYNLFVYSLHLRPESKEDMITRLSEDRFLNNTVVS